MVVFQWRSCSTKGHLPLMVVFHQRSSSTEGRLQPKVIFHRRSSSTKGCLPPKVVFHQRLSSTEGWSFNCENNKHTKSQSPTLFRSSLNYFWTNNMKQMHKATCWMLVLLRTTKISVSKQIVFISCKINFGSWKFVFPECFDTNKTKNLGSVCWNHQNCCEIYFYPSKVPADNCMAQGRSEFIFTPYMILRMGLELWSHAQLWDNLAFFPRGGGIYSS